MSYFAKPKVEPGKTDQEITPMKEADEAKSDEAVSTLGAGSLIKGKIVCEGPMQVFGRIVGEIHAVKLTIGHGAEVEGKITTRTTTIAGTFRGTINSENVRLESTAVVEAEIYKNVLVIDQDAQFEGMIGRLKNSTELPSAEQIFGNPVASPPAMVQPAAAKVEPAPAPSRGLLQRDTWTMAPVVRDVSVHEAP